LHSAVTIGNPGFPLNAFAIPLWVGGGRTPHSVYGYISSGMNPSISDTRLPATIQNPSPFADELAHRPHRGGEDDPRFAPRSRSPPASFPGRDHAVMFFVLLDAERDEPCERTHLDRGNMRTKFCEMDTIFSETATQSPSR